MRIGKREFLTEGKTYVMGILNVTPDSFSDGGRFDRLDDALYHAQEMVQDGADLIDVGGESTREGYTLLSDEEEIGRIAPVIEALKRRFDVPVSADTYKGAVADAAARAGADFINDIWGLQYDDKMAAVIASHGVPCCLMHNRKNRDYVSFLDDLRADLRESLAIAERAGIAPDKIVLDPGVGFAKTQENNLEAIRRVGELKELGHPLLLGVSRKSVIGKALDLPVGERLTGTLVSTAMAVERGVMFVRVHDVRENVRAIRMAEAILGRG